MMKLFLSHAAIGFALLMGPAMITLVLTLVFGIIALKIILISLAGISCAIVISAILGAALEDSLPNRVRNWIRR